MSIYMRMSFFEALRVCVRVYIHTYYTNMHTCICMYTYTQTYTYSHLLRLGHIRRSIFICIHEHTCIHTCIHTYIHTHTHTHYLRLDHIKRSIFICMHVHTYIHTHTHTISALTISSVVAPVAALKLSSVYLTLCTFMSYTTCTTEPRIPETYSPGFRRNSLFACESGQREPFMAFVWMRYNGLVASYACSTMICHLCMYVYM